MCSSLLPWSLPAALQFIPPQGWMVACAVCPEWETAAWCCLVLTVCVSVLRLP